MLYTPRRVEFSGSTGVTDAAERLRQLLGEQITECQSVELRDGLREIQAALREFLTVVSDHGSERSNPFWRALREMRARVGATAGALADAFRVTVDGDLSRVVQQGHNHS